MTKRKTVSGRSAGEDRDQADMSRRQFLTGAGVLSAGAAVAGLSACVPTSQMASGGASSGATATAEATSGPNAMPPRSTGTSVFVGTRKATEMGLHVTKTYDPSRIEYAALDGEPSRNHYFVPTQDEGIRNRVYPNYDAKTLKFLTLSSPSHYPQTYYLFDKSGGTLNPALKASGYKAVRIIDQGHIKILPNLMVGYYDFAYLTSAILSELWSGNESMNPELWKQGNDYVIVGCSSLGGTWMLARPGINSLRDLAKTRVGVMNPSYNILALLDKALAKEGLATEGAGGNVAVEMAPPGQIMNESMAGKLSAIFSWSIFTMKLEKQFGYKVLVPWQQLGYGDQVPNMLLVARRDIIEKHPDIVQTVVQLNYDATKEALANGDYEAPLEKISREFQTTYMGQLPAEPAGEMPLQAEASPAFLKDLVAYMQKQGYFKVPYTYEQLVDHSFYEKVTK